MHNKLTGVDRFIRAASIETRRKIHDFMVAYLPTYHRLPTVREIAAYMGWSSTNGVHRHLRAMERQGLLVRNREVPRASYRLNLTVQVLR